MDNISIGIIGGGPAGLISLYECKIRDIKATLYEKENNVGGIWNLESSKPHGHKSTIFNSSSFLLSYNLEFPFFQYVRNKYPSKNVDYPTGLDYSEYQHAFIKHYQLGEMIHINKEVIQIIFESTKTFFRIKILNLENGLEETCNHDYVIVATGKYQNLVIPKDPFLSKNLKMNTDKVWHTSYWDPLNSENSTWNLWKQGSMTFLVIGGGHSAGEAIQDTLIRSKKEGNYEEIKIYWAPTRTPEDRNVWLLDRYPYHEKNMFLPLDEMISRFTNYLPQKIIGKMQKEVCTNVFNHRSNASINFDKDVICICKTKIVSKGIKDQIIHIISDSISKIYIDTNQIMFDTLSMNSVPVDIVIIGSGFTNSEPMINNQYVFNNSEFYRCIIPVDKSLDGRVGYLCTTQIIGSSISTTQMEIRWLLYQWLDKNNTFNKNNILKSLSSIKPQKPKNLKRSPGLMMDELANDMNLRPNLWRNLFNVYNRRRHLSLAYLFGPWSIYQYPSINETNAERFKRESIVLSETQRIFKLRGKDFQLICTISDIFYYFNIGMIFSLIYLYRDSFVNQFRNILNVIQ